MTNAYVSILAYSKLFLFYSISGEETNVLNDFSAFCYMSRGTDNGCNAKEGNPFGPFWDTFNIDFVKSEFYGPLHYDTHHHNMADRWHER